MASNDETSRLIRALRELYIKISAFAVSRRVNAYRSHTTSTIGFDISGPLTKQLDKLVAETKQHSASVTVMSAGQHADDSHADISNKHEWQPVLVSHVDDGFSRDVKLSARKNETDQYMGEKLKASTWSHMRLAFMNARKGEADMAKLHAGISSQALKEAAHYLSDDDYNVLCTDVKKAVSEAQDINK